MNFAEEIKKSYLKHSKYKLFECEWKWNAEMNVYLGEKLPFLRSASLFKFLLFLVKLFLVTTFIRE